MTTPAEPTDPLSHLLSSLGHAPDAEIAERAGVPVDLVKARRRELGIAPYLRAPPGSAPAPAPPAPSTSASGAVVLRRRAGGDGEVSRRVSPQPTVHATVSAPIEPAPTTKRSRSPVLETRSADLGNANDASATEARSARSPRAEATPRRRKSKMDALFHLLGVQPDAEVARLAQVTPENVRAYRKRHGIGATAPAPQPEPAPAGTAEVRERRSRMTPWLHLIGTMPDGEVAALAGTTVDNVRHHRKRRGIAAFGGAAVDGMPTELASTPLLVKAELTHGAAAAERRKPGRKSAIDAHAHLLGTVPDGEVARLSGASVAAVSQYRARRKIAPFRVEPTMSEPVSVAPSRPEAQPSTPARTEVEIERGPALAFKVRARNGDEDRVFLVVASDIVEAATLAVRGLAARSDGPWQLRRLKVVGEGLRG